MPTLEATRIVRYAGKDQQIGDRFEAPEKDAKILVAIEKAKYSDAPAKSPSDLPDDVMSRAVKIGETPVEDFEEVEKDVDPKPAQTYLHRAMVAEAPKAPPPPAPKAKPVEPMRFTPSPSPEKRKPGRPAGKGKR